MKLKRKQTKRLRKWKKNTASKEKESNLISYLSYLFKVICLVNMTLAIPQKLHKTMKKHPEIKWTEIARQAIEKTAELLEAETSPLRAYAYKRLVEEGEDAEKLFKF